MGSHGDADKIGGVAKRRILAAGPRQDGHSGFGQVVVHQVLQPWHLQQLGCGNAGVTPESTGTANTDAAVGRGGCGAHAISSMRSNRLPLVACVLGLACSSTTRPAMGAVKLCSIFMASSTASGWPWLTV
ncbi:hypothetical protein D3C72_1114430 [compost metagenome]